MITKIGNSYGIILSKKLLEQAKLKDKVAISFLDNKITIEAIETNPRKDWEAILLKAGSLQDKEKYYEEFNNKFDEEQWTW